MRPKKKKVKAADDETPNDTQDEPNASAWNTIPIGAKVFALSIINAGRTRKGLKPLTHLVQDEEILPGGVAPRDPEAFERAVVNAARKARAQEPLKPSEFISRGR
jgi:hypothetical protein